MFEARGRGPRKPRVQAARRRGRARHCPAVRRPALRTMHWASYRIHLSTPGSAVLVG